MARRNTKDDAAELAALNAKLEALNATVERLMKDKAIREPVDALIRALRGHTPLEISRVLDEIYEDVFGALADEDADDDTVGSHRPMMLRRKVLLNGLAKKQLLASAIADRVPFSSSLFTPPLFLHPIEILQPLTQRHSLANNQLDHLW